MTFSAQDYAAGPISNSPLASPYVPSAPAAAAVAAPAGPQGDPDYWGAKARIDPGYRGVLSALTGEAGLDFLDLGDTQGMQKPAWWRDDVLPWEQVQANAAGNTQSIMSRLGHQQRSADAGAANDAAARGMLESGGTLTEFAKNQTSYDAQAYDARQSLARRSGARDAQQGQALGSVAAQLKADSEADTTTPPSTGPNAPPAPYVPSTSVPQEPGVLSPGGGVFNDPATGGTFVQPRAGNDDALRRLPNRLPPSSAPKPLPKVPTKPRSTFGGSGL